MVETVPNCFLCRSAFAILALVDREYPGLGWRRHEYVCTGFSSVSLPRGVNAFLNFLEFFPNVRLFVLIIRWRNLEVEISFLDFDNPRLLAVLRA